MAHVIHSCKHCPHLRSEPKGASYCAAREVAPRPIKKPEAQPAWCPLPEDDPNDT